MSNIESMMSNLTSLNWAFEYELPNLSLVLTHMVAAETENEALAAFRKHRPHGRLRKINGRPVQDDGVNVRFLDESP